jgi:peptidoglycan/LPS O-acetylase OafA/YrhL
MRNARLDVLRCVAVLLVLARHGSENVPFHAEGWAGVDLFFVLSGFLISGLLFAEYKKRGGVDFKRFFIRRGLKIYPMFYLLLVVGYFGQLALHTVSPLRNYLSEIFYLQNYLPNVWMHTWSLAVEEHFYIFLPALLFVLIRLSSDRVNPFRAIPLVFLVIAAACLTFRFIAMLSLPPGGFVVTDSSKAFSHTHERIDSLFFGVLLGYFYHFKPSRLRVFESKPTALLLLVVAAALISPCFFFGATSRFMVTAGFTLLYLGFGIILMVSLQIRGLFRGASAWALERIGRAFAFVGMYSYSIYIWHIGIHSWLPGIIRRATFYKIDLRHSDVFYIVASITLGILASRLIEYPVLRIRDRIFPPGPSPVVEQQ